MSHPRYNVLIPTDYGTMLVNRNDYCNRFPGVGVQLLQTGVYDAEEIALFRQLLQRIPAEGCALDIGANIGVHTLLMAQTLLQRKGTVHAFEAQRIVFQMLCANVALNSLPNVHCHHVALGKSAGELPIPAFDYTQPASFGSVEFGHEQREDIGQKPGQSNEFVRMLRLDDFPLKNVNLIKLDVEGMEVSVLEGAGKIISEQRPTVYLEWYKSDAGKLQSMLRDWKYHVWQYQHNYLCVPVETTIKIEGLQQLF